MLRAGFRYLAVALSDVGDHVQFMGLKPSLPSQRAVIFPPLLQDTPLGGESLVYMAGACKPNNVCGKAAATFDVATANCSLRWTHV